MPFAKGHETLAPPLFCILRVNVTHMAVLFNFFAITSEQNSKWRWYMLPHQNMCRHISEYIQVIQYIRDDPHASSDAFFQMQRKKQHFVLGGKVFICAFMLSTWNSIYIPLVRSLLEAVFFESVAMRHHRKARVSEGVEDAVLGEAIRWTEIWENFRDVEAFGPALHWIPLLRSRRPLGLAWKYLPFSMAPPQPLNHQPPER